MVAELLKKVWYAGEEASINLLFLFLKGLGPLIDIGDTYIGIFFNVEFFIVLVSKSSYF